MTTWSTDPATGLVTVDFEDGAGTQTPIFSTRTASVFKRQVIDKWGSLIAKHAARVGVPFSHIAGLIYRESGGSASIVSFDGGIGLMQITSPSLRGTHTTDELKDPELNVQIGTDYFSSLWHKYNGDLPRAAAAYNAGSARPCDPKKPDFCNKEWNLFATIGHVSAVVDGSNTSIYNGWDPTTGYVPLAPLMIADAPSKNSAGVVLVAGAALGFVSYKMMKSPRVRKFFKIRSK